MHLPTLIFAFRTPAPLKPGHASDPSQSPNKKELTAKERETFRQTVRDDRMAVAGALQDIVDSLQKQLLDRAKAEQYVNQPIDLFRKTIEDKKKELATVNVDVQLEDAPTEVVPDELLAPAKDQEGEEDKMDYT